MLASHPKIDLPILHLIGEEADRLGLECYVIGGYVRDIFLHRESTDIDVVVVGKNTLLAHEASQGLLAQKAESGFLVSSLAQWPSSSVCSTQVIQRV